MIEGKKILDLGYHGVVPIELWIDGHEVDTLENPHIDTLMEGLFEILYPDGEHECPSNSTE